MVDYHVHTTFSDGERTPKEVIDLAVALGIEKLAITDHFDVYDPGLSGHQKTTGELLRHFDRIRNLAGGKPITVYCGIETCTDEYGHLRIDRECLSACDLIITSPHYIEGDYPFRQGVYFCDAYWLAYKKKLLMMAAGEGHVLGHPEGYLPIGPMLVEGTTYEGRQEICRSISVEYFDPAFIQELGEQLKKSGKAYELHGATKTPREWVVEALAKQDILFSPGSDAHAVNILGKNERAMELVKKYNLKLYEPEHGRTCR
ncbi:PHP domain-containing protein [Lacrimispora celerecrescens]|uniref:Putative hydrolase n=1 Tax=[Clostridium] celerecrescens 18A TaxID=1286362 RepID=A0A2M8Z1J1_9FIRM|nr:PHP domain-containing protein [Lacrimispora celerecrescens]PJJ27292.1 putative hydrolase [[Clostridium] celerecrescens 18A]